jgi:hypothetical protein
VRSRQASVATKVIEVEENHLLVRLPGHSSLEKSVVIWNNKDFAAAGCVELLPLGGSVAEFSHA